MENMFMILGKIKEIEKQGEERKKIILTIGVSRSFKNVDGEYDIDDVKCTLWGGIGENTLEYCKKGDTIAVKGRIQVIENEIELVAEKLSFLSIKEENK